MSQSVKEFVRQSGVDVRKSPDYNSNNNFARELEMEMERAERANAAERMARRESIVRGQQFFREPTRPEIQRRRPAPLENEFADVNINKLVNNALREPIDTSEFNELPPINENAFEKALAEMNPAMVNEFSDLSILEISPLKPGMFNAGVDSGYGQKDVVVNLKQIIAKKPLAKMQIVEGLYIETLEMVGRYGQQQIALRHTRNLGLKGSMNIPLVTVEFKMIISNDKGESNGVNVNIYKNGKIRFSGGFLVSHLLRQPELIRRYVVDNYTTKEPFFYNPIQFNNLSGQFNINGVFNMERIRPKFEKYGRVNYEPELSPIMYVTMNGYTLNITKSGNIQIIGAKNTAILENAYKANSQLIRQFIIGEDIVIKKVRRSPKRKAKPKPKAKPVAKSKMKLTNNQINALKIDGKRCERMGRAELVDLARKMGVVNFRTKTRDGTRDATKLEICDRIRKISGQKVATFKNVNKKKNTKLSGTAETFRVGGKICSTEKKDELIRIAKILKIQLGDKETKKTICQKIEKVRNNLSKPKPPPPPKPTKRKIQQNKKAAVVTKKMQVRAKRIGIDENSIRRDLIKEFGSSWMNRYKPNLNQDIKNVKNAISRVGRNNRDKSLGLPRKMVVDKIKKQMVSNWKMQRRKELEKNYLIKSANVTGIPYNLRNNYRRAAANYVMNQKRPPSNKKMAEYRKYWLKFRANVNANGNARRTVGAARARVEKI